MRGARRLLSARNLDDVPAKIRIGSPYDASDDLVYRAAKKGFLPAGTNYGVVFRVAFAPQLAPGEEPASPTTLTGLPVEEMPTTLLLRFGYVFPPEQISTSGDSISITMKWEDFEQTRFAAWMLLSNRGIRWHFTLDGAPQVHPGLEPDLAGGVRFLPYSALRGPSAHHATALAGPSQTIEIDLFVFEVGGRFYGFGLSGGFAPENLRWYDYVRGAAES